MKLNVGCGHEVKEGWINLDKYKVFGADFLHDLRSPFMPFKDNVFDYVYCSHVLEDFLDFVPLLDELVRITKVGGLIEIKTPFETNTWTSTCHMRPFNLSTFYSYANSPDYENKYKSVEIIEEGYYRGYTKGFKFLYSKLGSMIYNVVGRRATEGTFLKYLFPCVSIRVVLRKVIK